MVSDQELPDLSDVDLRELFRDDDTNLPQVIERLVDSLDDPDGVISAFQSFAGGGSG
jgi:hypothetical protein